MSTEKRGFKFSHESLVNNQKRKEIKPRGPQVIGLGKGSPFWARVVAKGWCGEHRGGIPQLGHYAHLIFSSLKPPDQEVLSPLLSTFFP